MYVLWNLPTSPVLSLSKFISSNVKSISAAVAGISTTSTEVLVPAGLPSPWH